MIGSLVNPSTCLIGPPTSGVLDRLPGQSFHLFDRPSDQLARRRAQAARGTRRGRTGGWGWRPCGSTWPPAGGLWRASCGWASTSSPSVRPIPSPSLRRVPSPSVRNARFSLFLDRPPTNCADSLIGSPTIPQSRAVPCGVRRHGCPGGGGPVSVLQARPLRVEEPSRSAGRPLVGRCAVLGLS